MAENISLGQKEKYIKVFGLLDNNTTLYSRLTLSILPKETPFLLH